jgi:hypothetical protein
MKTSKKKKAFSFDPANFADQLSSHIASDFNVEPLDPESWEFLRQAQLSATKKKFQSPNASQITRSSLAKAAVDKFSSINNHLADFDPRLPNPGELRSTRYHPDLERDFRLVRARAFCHSLLGEAPDTSELFSACRHGPRTSLGVPYMDSGLSRKWVLPLTATEEVRGLVEMYFSWDTSLQRAYLTDLKKLSGTLGIHAKALKYVQAARLTTVPKNDSTDRTIAVEPTLNMFFQLGLGNCIVKRLAEASVDLEHLQPVHAESAWRSSLTRVSGTVDFSNASDYISIGLVKFLLPGPWLHLLQMVRTSCVDLPDKTRLTLSCFSTMGNGATFALETIVFLSLAVACLPVDNPRTTLVDADWPERVSVFGDDCILPSDCVESFLDLTRSLGMSPNLEKTFWGWKDKFRESCGGDYFAGRNVRPFYLKGPRSLKTSCVRAYLYGVFNLLKTKYILYFGEFTYVYKDALRFVADEIVRCNSELLVVPPSDPIDAGLHADLDDIRLRRLFSGIPHGPLTLDQNGSVRYRRLTSATDLSGTYIDSIELWGKLRSAACPAFTKSLPFEVRKGDMGYVVTSGIDPSHAIFPDTWFCGPKQRKAVLDRLTAWLTGSTDTSM